MEDIVEIRGLEKSYRDVSVLKHINCAIGANKIYGFLGRNGAGKTTLMKMLCGQLLPTQGELKVFGEKPYENRRVLSQICFIKESQKYPDVFKVKDVLDISESIFPNWDKEYAYSLIEEFQLPLKRRVKALSRGMTSSVGIVIGLASRAPLTIFDEPYLGLDAVARSVFYDRLIEDYSEYPRTIVLSTHLIDEVSKILEHVILIEQGEILWDEDAEKLRGKAFKIIGDKAVVEAFASGKEVIDRETLGGMASLTISDGLSKEERQKAETVGIQIEPLSLQQFVVQLTQYKRNKGGVSS
ncbi:ABC transporter ATP-binding protein [Marinicrinis lubricantis]|uniref:ABC transporter ATP-binding protein n=1 Tax=Marinicrinis lubricantis TaxID=2086470 RepID=A0ABW1IPF9_9BACL